jgi:hypothetical protein
MKSKTPPAAIPATPSPIEGQMRGFRKRALRSHSRPLTFGLDVQNILFDDVKLS